MDLFFYHAAINPNHPAAAVVHLGDRRDMSMLRDILLNLQDRGLPVLYFDENVADKAFGAIPDSSELSPSDLDELGPYLRHLKCGKEIENGNVCSHNKFNTTICPGREHMLSHHPGWKWHALVGNLLAMALIELLQDGLSEISKTGPGEYESLLHTLQSEEKHDFKAFVRAELPKDVAASVPFVNENTKFDLNMLFKRRSICHTGLLPAESRFLGILTQSNQIGFRSETTGYTGYDQGFDFKSIKGVSNAGKEMRLVYSAASRIKNCEVPVSQDFKDFFLVQEGDDWQSITLPNTAEMEIYGKGKNLKGMIALCLAHCTLGKCFTGDIRENVAASSRRVEFNINGIAVESFSVWDTCLFPYHENGYTWEPNDEGRYEIEVNVIETGDYIRFSSIVIW